MYHDMAIEDIAFRSDWYSFSCSLGVELVLDELVWSTWQLEWDWLMIHLSCRKSVTWQVSDYVIYWPNWLSSSHGTNMNTSLQWRHNGRDGVSNHQPHQCLLNRLLRRSKKTSKFRAIGLCVGNSPVNSPHKCPVRGECIHLMTSSWLMQWPNRKYAMIQWTCRISLTWHRCYWVVLVTGQIRSSFSSSLRI